MREPHMTSAVITKSLKNWRQNTALDRTMRHAFLHFLIGFEVARSLVGSPPSPHMPSPKWWCIENPKVTTECRTGVNCVFFTMDIITQLRQPFGMQDVYEYNIHYNI